MTDHPPEGSATAPPSPPRIRLGIETISDVVFGLALEIGAVSLVAKLPQSTTDLVGDIVAFGFSFLVVFLAWVAYRRVVVALPHETEATVVVNVALLFCVSIEPFLFYVLVVGPSQVADPASTAFALDVGVMMLLLAVLHFLLLAEERKAPHRNVRPQTLSHLRDISLGRTVGGLTFLLSALPFFSYGGPLGISLRETLWWIGLVLFQVVQRASSVIGTRTAEEPD